MSDKTIDQFVETIHELESQLEAVKAERDELKAFVRQVKDAEPAYWPKLRNQAQELLKEDK